MSLSISIFKNDEQTGSPGEPMLIEGSGGLAGVERTRAELWGTETLVSLGARFLPQLAETDLWIQGPELDEFRKECSMLLASLRVVSEKTPWDAEYVKRCLQNFVAAVDEAKSVGGGLVID